MLLLGRLFAAGMSFWRIGVKIIAGDENNIYILMAPADRPWYHSQPYAKTAPTARSIQTSTSTVMTTDKTRVLEIDERLESALQLVDQTRGKGTNKQSGITDPTPSPPKYTCWRVKIYLPFDQLSKSRPDLTSAGKRH